jgi:xanthine dehydrogenase accessory factor
MRSVHGNDIFQRISDLHRSGSNFALATVVQAEDSTPRSMGARMILHPDGSIEGTVGGGALEKKVCEDAQRLLREGKSAVVEYDLGKGSEGVQTGMICGGHVQVLIETFGLDMKLFIFGAGHVGRKLSELARAVGITHWVIDNREDFARKELFPGAADVVHAEFDKSFSRLPIDEKSFIVIVTYGHQFDGTCLQGALETDARYIGMIGSTKKVRTLLNAAVEKGFNTDDDRIYAPVGLQLGDSSPEQIGISILAEILKLKSGGSGEHMRSGLGKNR